MSDSKGGHGAWSLCPKGGWRAVSGPGGAWRQEVTLREVPSVDGKELDQQEQVSYRRGGAGTRSRQIPENERPKHHHKSRYPTASRQEGGKDHPEMNTGK